jgi:dihydroorotate dehydrogenase
VEALGFAFAEIGSVTARPCAGNPRPRIFRLVEDQSLINWMGLPNHGAAAIAQNLSRLHSHFPLLVNIAKTPDFSGKEQSLSSGIADYLESYKKLATHGQAIVFNLSCPNTGEHTSFEDPRIFAALALEIATARRHIKADKPHLIKISPDLDPEKLPKLVEIALKGGFEGFVVSNTSKERYNLKSKLPENLLSRGGLSGAGLSYLANQKLAHVFSIAGKNALLIGVGGIMNFKDMLLKFSLGASLVQVYTGLIFGGPLFVRGLNRELKKHCETLGLKSYRELIGRPMREIS